MLLSLAGRQILIAEEPEVNAEVPTDLAGPGEDGSKWAENRESAGSMLADGEERRFDAIRMDPRTPILEGLAATLAVQKPDCPDTAKIPMIAHASEEDVQAGINAHPDTERLKDELNRPV